MLRPIRRLDARAALTSERENGLQRVAVALAVLAWVGTTLLLETLLQDLLISFITGSVMVTAAAGTLSAVLGSGSHAK